MTTHRGPLSENEKTIWICLLFPLFWPFLPVILICMGIEKIRDAYWGWKYRRAERRELH
jgi:hypothetical protein